MAGPRTTACLAPPSSPNRRTGSGRLASRPNSRRARPRGFWGADRPCRIRRCSGAAAPAGGTSVVGPVPPCAWPAMSLALARHVHISASQPRVAHGASTTSDRVCPLSRPGRLGDPAGVHRRRAPDHPRPCERAHAFLGILACSIDGFGPDFCQTVSPSCVLGCMGGRPLGVAHASTRFRSCLRRGLCGPTGLRIRVVSSSDRSAQRPLRRRLGNLPQE